MAKKIESESPTKDARIIGKKAFLEFVDNLQKQDDAAKRAKGRMGKMVADVVADENVHADALRVFRKYRNKAPSSQAEFLLHLETYWEYGALGEPEDDLVETPADRKNRMTKGEAEDEKEAQEAARQNRRDENRLTAGTHKIEKGKVVPINGEAQPEAAAG